MDEAVRICVFGFGADPGTAAALADRLEKMGFGYTGIGDMLLTDIVPADEVPSLEDIVGLLRQVAPSVQVRYSLFKCTVDMAEWVDPPHTNGFAK